MVGSDKADPLIPMSELSEFKTILTMKQSDTQFNETTTQAFISKQIGSDYYILPSSVHELLILRKKDCDITENELRSMVREINQSIVSPEEILGNEVFEYRADMDRVKKCVKGERAR